ncbi:hypothetical protein KIN20_031242 [Parelaphostrongylus tenuis]|uniref:RING-type domain-containing protein n=1 Tax=Parelaphostrongylus tenuis TaxID=148309 RepID=A0AAD5R4V1_PARTN|nr:hypothetical protein KIN20_031242 [Parelaphostrongylus tenuis]
MWSAGEILRRLIPSCSCGAEYDRRFCAPHILPCSHTFCLMCLSKDKQRKKRRCPLCQKKYSSFILNTALAEMVDRMRLRRECLEEKTGKCDECDSRRPVTAMRRCLTCFRGINKHISAGLTLDCVICLECCVGRHNGHDFMVLSFTPSQTSERERTITLPTTNVDSKRYLPWRAMSKQMKIFRQGKMADCELCKIDLRIGMSSCAVEEDLVCETRSPLYYNVSSSLSEDVSNKSSISTLLSNLTRSVFGSGTCVTKRNEAVQKSKSLFWQASNTSFAASNEQEDSSAYQTISPCRNIRKTASSTLPSDSSNSRLIDSYYVNVYRRHSG